MTSRRNRIMTGPGTLPTLSDPYAKRATLRVELLTRQFGGGATARKTDQDQWLRSTAVRGALRFWWRALYGSQFSSLHELRISEMALFGSAASADSKPGLVSVMCDSERGGTTEQYAHRSGDVSSVAYFPALEFGDAQAAHLLRANLKANISLAADGACSADQWNQIRTALAAYVTFGGSGARTRRTAGALGWCDVQQAQAIGIPTSIEACSRWWAGLPTGGVDHRMFSLHDRVLLAFKRADSAERAQRDVLEFWRDVRQWRRHPSTWTGAGPWGRSDWPEADALRVVFRRHSAHHAPRAGNQGRAPRAHLGLPLIIKFKDRSGDPDPAELVLTQDKGKDRYASPVLTTVVRIDGGFLGLIAATRSRLTGNVTIRGRSEALAVGPVEDVYGRIREQLHAHSFTTIGGEDQ